MKKPTILSKLANCKTTVALEHDSRGYFIFRNLPSPKPTEMLVQTKSGIHFKNLPKLLRGKQNQTDKKRQRPFLKEERVPARSESYH